MPAGESRLSFEGKRFPTFFKVMKGSERRGAHLGQRFKVQFETDAENGYFDRQVEPGQLELWAAGEPLQADPPNLMNGVATLNLHLPPGAVAGEIVRYRGHVIDSAHVNPFEFAFEREVLRPAESKGGRGRRLPPVDPSEPGPRQTPTLRGLPPITSVRKPDWGRYSFDAESALLARSNPEGGYDFFVNLDNKYLHGELRSRPGQRAILEAQFKYGLALFGLALIRYLTEGPDHDADVEDWTVRLSRAFAPFLLPMIDGLSRLSEAPEPPEDDASALEGTTD